MRDKRFVVLNAAIAALLVVPELLRRGYGPDGSFDFQSISLWASLVVSWIFVLTALLLAHNPPSWVHGALLLTTIAWTYLVAAFFEISRSEYDQALWVLLNYAYLAAATVNIVVLTKQLIQPLLAARRARSGPTNASETTR